MQQFPACCVSKRRLPMALTKDIEEPDAAAAAAVAAHRHRHTAFCVTGNAFQIQLSVVEFHFEIEFILQWSGRHCVRSRHGIKIELDILSLAHSVFSLSISLFLSVSFCCFDSAACAGSVCSQCVIRWQGELWQEFENGFLNGVYTPFRQWMYMLMDFFCDAAWFLVSFFQPWQSTDGVGVFVCTTTTFGTCTNIDSKLLRQS